MRVGHETQMLTSHLFVITTVLAPTGEWKDIETQKLDFIM